MLARLSGQVSNHSIDGRRMCDYMSDRTALIKWQIMCSTLAMCLAGGQVCILYSVRADLEYLSSAFDQVPPLFAQQNLLRKGELK